MVEISGNVKIVVDYVYNQILIGEKELGAPISELEIAKALDMSRSPIREGLKVLEGEGILIHYPNRGTIVTDITYDDLAEIFELRIMFELQAVKRACQHMSDDTIAKLKANIEKLNETSTPQEYYSSNSALHEAIVQCSGNKRLAKFYTTINRQIGLVNRISGKLPNHFKESRRKHLEIVEALEKRDETLAYARLKKHLEEVRDTTLQAFK